MMTKTPEEMLRDLLPDWWQQARTVEELFKWFKTFLIGLLVGGQAGEKFQYFMYTGFLLEYNGKVLWLTAGHVIDNLSQALSSPNFSLSVMRWIDDFDVPGAEAIPVNHSQLKMKSWTSDGLDLGAIIIPFLESQNLLANNNVSIMEERVWKNLMQGSPEGYYVIGFPRTWNELNEKPIEGNKILRSIKADLACLPIKNIKPPINMEDDSFWKKQEAFFGELLPFPDAPNLKVENIEGMSGGPILSIERTEDHKIAIRLVGIQSSWKPTLGIVRAEPIEAIVDVLSKWEEFFREPNEKIQ
jgi:hypothetical protein